MVLQGRDGLSIHENPVNCTPCYLPIANEQLDQALVRPAIDPVCEVCSKPGHEDVMILGVTRNFRWYTHCLSLLHDQPHIQGTWIRLPPIALGD